MSSQTPGKKKKAKAQESIHPGPTSQKEPFPGRVYPNGRSGQVVNKRWDDVNPASPSKADRRDSGLYTPTRRELVFKPAAHYLAPATGEALADAQEMVHAALQHFGDNKEAVCSALELPAEVIDTLLADPQKGLSPKVLEKTSRFYRHRVTNADPLTGLFNRRAFILQMRQQISENTPFCLLFLDLDKFKPVNDQYGHKIGDKLLQSVGNRIRKNLPREASVCRLGGDEFAAFFPLKGHENVVQAFAQAVASSLHLPHYFEEMKTPVLVQASLGFSYFPEDGQTPEILLDKADQHMYASKNSFDKLPTTMDYIYYYSLMIGPILFFIVWIIVSFIKSGG